MTTSLTNLEVEIANETLDALVKAASSEDSTEIATVASEVPRLVLEVNRLRQERDERVRDLNRAKRKIQDQDAYIETLRPRAQAENRLRELEERVAVVVAQNEKLRRDHDEKERTNVALEERVKTLLAAMVELARGTSAEAYVKEAQEQRARAERAELEVAKMRIMAKDREA